MFSGVMTAMITPFINEMIDVEGLKLNVDAQLQAGVDSLLVFGTTGEGYALSIEEKQAVVDAVVSRVNAKIPVVVACQGIAVDAVVQQAIAAQDAGACAVLIVPPCYCCPTQDGIVQFFESIAKRIQIPIILYNHPKRSGVSIAVESVKRLMMCNTIIGIKDASQSLAYASSVLNIWPGCIFLSGDDLLTLPLLSIGACGVVSVLSNGAPDHMVELVKSRSLEKYRELYPLMRLTQCESNPIPIKAMMRILNLPSGPCRQPLTPLTDSFKPKIYQELLCLGLVEHVNG